MYWEIPKIPDKTIRKKPKYNIIISIYIAIITAIYIYASNLAAEQKTTLFIYLLPIITLFFFFIMAFLFIRHQHSVVTNTNWEQEKQETKKEWQAWCQSSITSLANVIYTPDKDGTGVFLADAEAIPMFPDKPRQFFNHQQIDENLLSTIDKQLEKQCPSYRFNLSRIYLFDRSNNSDIESRVFNQWHLQPEHSPSYDDIFSVYDQPQNDTFLILTVQIQTQYSEFISAQLFSTDNELINSNIDGIKIERMMKIDNQDIDGEIIKYIDYSGISRKNLFQTWITETKPDIISSIMMAYADKNIEVDKHHPINSLAMSYSTSHPDAFLTYLSLLTEISAKTKTDQVLIHLSPDVLGYAVYISNRS